MKLIKDYWFIIVIVLLFGGNLTQYLNPIIKVTEVVKRDTTTTVKIDSVSLIRAKAELNYLRSQLKSANGKIQYVTKVDTIRDKELIYIERNFIASLDTTFNQSKLKLQYHYPQNEFRNISFSYPKPITTVKETKTVETKKLFDFSHGIIAGAFVTPNGVIQIGVGYGFKLGLNL